MKKRDPKTLTALAGVVLATFAGLLIAQEPSENASEPAVDAVAAEPTDDGSAASGESAEAEAAGAAALGEAIGIGEGSEASCRVRIDARVLYAERVAPNAGLLAGPGDGLGLWSVGGKLDSCPRLAVDLHSNAHGR